MSTMISKWVYRCLGWVVMGCVALAAVSGYVLHKKKGYGTMELRVTWQGKGVPVDQLAGGDCELVVRGKRVAWTGSRGVRLRPGPVAAELKLKGFRPCPVSVDITKDMTAVAEFRLEAEPRTITVANVRSNGVVNGKPSSGSWVLQGAEVGRSYAVEVAAPGYHTNLLSLVIERPGEDLVTNVAWRPLMGFVRASVLPPVADTAVSVDGAALDPFAGGAVEVGVRTLSVSNGDYYPYSQRVEVSYGTTNACQVLLKPRPAQLVLQVTPSVQYQVRDGSGGTVALQGGATELPAGTNSLTVTAKGYVAQRREFVMEPNRKYAWQVELEREGVQAFKRSQADFLALSGGANLAVLEKGGGRAWERIRDTKFDEEDLVRGAQQYTKASEELNLLIENIKAVEEFSGRLQGMTNNSENAGLLERYGGSDWQKIRGTAFDSANVARCAQQYKDACESLAEVLRTMPDRGQVWTNEQRVANSVDYWIVMGEYAKASVNVAEYETRFGPGTDFDRWFGGGGRKVRAWQESIRVKEQYAPRVIIPNYDKKKKK